MVSKLALPEISESAIGLPHGSGGAVHLHESSRGEPIGSPFQPYDAGDAELARNDRGVRKQAAAFHHDRGSIGKRRNPSGIGVMGNENLARLERFSSRVPNDTHAPLHDAGRTPRSVPEIAVNGASAFLGLLECLAQRGTGEGQAFRWVAMLLREARLRLANGDEPLEIAAYCESLDRSQNLRDRQHEDVARFVDRAARMELAAHGKKQQPRAPEYSRPLEAQILAVAHARLGPAEHARKD